MLWIIIGIPFILVCLFLVIVAKNASNSKDEETQRLEDEEQTKAVEEYMRKNN